MIQFSSSVNPMKRLRVLLGLAALLAASTAVTLVPTAGSVCNSTVKPFVPEGQSPANAASDPDAPEEEVPPAEPIVITWGPEGAPLETPERPIRFSTESCGAW